MTYYGVRHLADAFRTVRKNTIAIAQDIPEDKYAFKAAPNTRTVSQLLIHLAVSPAWQQELHSQRVASLEGYDFPYSQRIRPTSKCHARRRRSSTCYSGRPRHSRPFSRT
jgi:hypothetical protein